MSDEVIIFNDGNGKGFMPRSALKGFTEALRKAEQQLWWPDQNYVAPPEKYFAYIRLNGETHDTLVWHWKKDDKMERVGDSYEHTGEFYEKDSYSFVRYATRWDL